MNDDKRIVTSAYRKETASQGNGAGDLSLPATHDSQMSAKHFLVDNIIEGLAS
jgi:hypothetical protein